MADNAWLRKQNVGKTGLETLTSFQSLAGRIRNL